MTCRSCTTTVTLCPPVLFLFATILFLPLGSASADSITVDGKHYENIYLGAGAEMYYIQDPADGSMITVPKSAVKEKDIQITADREARRKLRDQWRLKRMNKTTDAPADAAPRTDWKKELPTVVEPPAPRKDATMKDLDQPVVISGFGRDEKNPTATTTATSATSAPAERKKPVVIGNIKPKSQGRTVFMDAKGTPVATNMPEEYRDRPEYVEVTLHLEQIEVPEQFRVTKGTAAPTKQVTGDSKVEDIVKYYAGRYALDESLVFAVIKAESNGNRFAVSSAGARGLMQLMPGTARDMGVKDIFDPAENIAGGTQYLAKMLNLFDNNVSFALAGYNAGPGNVQKHGGIPPFKETQDYVKRVKLYQRQFAKEGKPHIQLAADRPVEKNYLPPESKAYYQIILDNGLSVAAEKVYQEEDRYIYVFKGRSGHFTRDAVVKIVEPI